MIKKENQTVENLLKKTIKNSVVVAHNSHLEYGLSIREYIWQVYESHIFHLLSREEYFKVINGNELFEIQFLTTRNQENPFHFIHGDFNKLLEKSFEIIWMEQYRNRHKHLLSDEALKIRRRR